MKTLIIVDMQNDFIDGSLANPAAAAIIPAMTEYIKSFEGNIIVTHDTHGSNYLETQEGQNLPIEHCIKHTHGWQISSDILTAIKEHWYAIYGKQFMSCSVFKESFGDVSQLTDQLNRLWNDEIYLCGTCTDICVISMALNLKTFYPETKMYCIADLCAGTAPEKHNAALEVMKSCQIEVI